MPPPQQAKLGFRVRVALGDESLTDKIKVRFRVGVTLGNVPQPHPEVKHKLEVMVKADVPGWMVKI